MKYIYVSVFAFSFLIGLLFVYLSRPVNKAVNVYPTPENINTVEYVDKVGTCYKYKTKMVSCSKDAKTIPLQE